MPLARKPSVRKLQIFLFILPTINPFRAVGRYEINVLLQLSLNMIVSQIRLCQQALT